MHNRWERPWGSYLVLHEQSDSHKVKIIEVSPGQRLSLQSHALRAEHWYVVAGTGIATLDDELIPITAGSSVDIPAGTRHRLQASPGSVLTLIEVQQGSYFGEDDITRYDDDYGRTSEPQTISLVHAEHSPR